MEEQFPFLGLGSMVEVEDLEALPDTLYVIIARALAQDNTGKTVSRYRLAPHPLGAIPSQEEHLLTVREDQIQKIRTNGYTNEKDASFFMEMENKMQASLDKPASISNRVEVVEKELQEDLQKKEIRLKEEESRKKVEEEHLEKERQQRKRDPFYLFRKEREYR